jgi:hypothetical protein
VAGGVFMTLSYWMFKQMAEGEWKNIFNYGAVNDNKKINAVPLFENLYFIIGLIPAIFYLALSKLSLKRFRENGDPKVLYFFIGLASFAIALIPALQFSGKWITFA